MTKQYSVIVIAVVYLSNPFSYIMALFFFIKFHFICELLTEQIWKDEKEHRSATISGQFTIFIFLNIIRIFID